MSNKKEWENIHQPYELKFHKQTNNYRFHDEKYEKFWTDVFGDFMGMTKDEFTDDTVMIDIGCGSRPCLDWFNSSNENKHHLDPLMKQYFTIKEMLPYWEGKPKENIYCQPAEEMVEALRGKCDFVLCSNVLDHTYDWREILANMSAYCKKDAIVCFNTDLSSHGIGHPGIDSPKEFHQFFEDNFEILKSVPKFWKREVFYKLRKK